MLAISPPEIVVISIIWKYLEKTSGVSEVLFFHLQNKEWVQNRVGEHKNDRTNSLNMQGFYLDEGRGRGTHPLDFFLPLGLFFAPPPHLYSFPPHSELCLKGVCFKLNLKNIYGGWGKKERESEA